jgi:regulator of sirC expression with transglutaminase-like and TPR domain
MDRKEILAMISLLDDTDREVVVSVSGNIIRQGSVVIPDLEKAWEESPSEMLQTRLENLIQEIQFNEVKNNLLLWLEGGAANVLEGAFFVAKTQFPEISMLKVNEHIEKIRKDAWIEMNNNITALEKVKILNYIFFDLYQFRSNSADFYSPKNSYINQVFDTRKGNQISLSIIYLSVAAKLGLPIYGVNLPKNFILAYKDELVEHVSEDEVEDILFYINPYNKGAILGRREIDYFLDQHQLKPQPSYYLPCSNRDIIIRLIHNLILSFEKLGYAQKITRMKELLRVLDA